MGYTISQVADVSLAFTSHVAPEHRLHADLSVDAIFPRFSDLDGFSTGRRRLLTELNQQGLPTESRDFLRLAARMQLPLFLWLGWHLYRWPKIIAYNLPQTGPVPFLGSKRGQTPREPGAFFESEGRVDAEVHDGDDILIVLDAIGGRLLESDVRKTLNARRHFQSAHFLSRRQEERIEFRPRDLKGALQEALWLVKDLRRRSNVGRIHIAVTGPDVFAFFLGQELYAFADPIVLDEYDQTTGTYFEALPLTAPEAE